MKISLHILLVFLILEGNAQTSNLLKQDDIDVINLSIRNKREGLLLIAETSTYHLGEIKKQVDKKMFTKRVANKSGKTITDTLKLSAGDLEQIEQQLAALKDFTWTTENANKIKLSIKSIISRDTAYSEKLVSARKYSIVPPIYFQDNNYCIFYFDYACGPLCGNGRMAVYKKTSTGWQLWHVLREWVS